MSHSHVKGLGWSQNESLQAENYLSASPPTAIKMSPTHISQMPLIMKLIIHFRMDVPHKMWVFSHLIKSPAPAGLQPGDITAVPGRAATRSAGTWCGGSRGTQPLWHDATFPPLSRGSPRSPGAAHLPTQGPPASAHASGPGRRGLTHLRASYAAARRRGTTTPPP